MGRRFISRLHRDAALAVNQLRRQPGFVCVTTLTLALGIAVTTAVFAVVDTVILRTLPCMEPDRLMVVRRAQPGGKTPVEPTYPEYRGVRDGANAFSGLAAVPSSLQQAVRTDGDANETLAATCSTCSGRERYSDARSRPMTIAVARRRSSCSATGRGSVSSAVSSRLSDNASS